MSLSEKDYDKYLSLAYFLKTGQKLNLKHPKTLNEKIQWLKLYDNFPIKTQLADKVLVREWIKERIDENYLKPVLLICDNFDEIDFDKLPESFIIKCNHGTKWHSVITNKSAFLKNRQLYNKTRETFNGWLNQTFFGWSDFELQYYHITPKILIEPLLRDEKNVLAKEIEVYCFNSYPRLTLRCIHEKTERKCCVYDEHLNEVNLKVCHTDVPFSIEIDENLKMAVELSRKLSKDFKFVRIDWMIYENKLYFGEMTFTPYSGYIPFPPEYKKWNSKLGNMLNLKGD